MKEYKGEFDLFALGLEELLSSYLIRCFVCQSEYEYIIKFEKHKTFTFNKKDLSKGEQKRFAKGLYSVSMSKEIGDELFEYSESIVKEIMDNRL